MADFFQRDELLAGLNLNQQKELRENIGVATLLDDLNTFKVTADTIETNSNIFINIESKGNEKILTCINSSNGEAIWKNLPYFFDADIESISKDLLSNLNTLENLTVTETLKLNSNLSQNAVLVNSDSNGKVAWQYLTSNFMVDNSNLIPNVGALSNLYENTINNVKELSNNIVITLAKKEGFLSTESNLSELLDNSQALSNLGLNVHLDSKSIVTSSISATNMFCQSNFFGNEMKSSYINVEQEISTRDFFTNGTSIIDQELSTGSINTVNLKTEFFEIGDAINTTNINTVNAHAENSHVNNIFTSNLLLYSGRSNCILQLDSHNEVVALELESSFSNSSITKVPNSFALSNAVNVLNNRVETISTDQSFTGKYLQKSCNLSEFSAYNIEEIESVHSNMKLSKVARTGIWDDILNIPGNITAIDELYMRKDFSNVDFDTITLETLRDNLNFSSMAYENKANVQITGGEIRAHHFETDALILRENSNNIDNSRENIDDDVFLYLRNASGTNSGTGIWTNLPIKQGYSESGSNSIPSSSALSNLVSYLTSTDSNVYKTSNQVVVTTDLDWTSNIEYMSNLEFQSNMIYFSNLVYTSNDTGLTSNYFVTSNLEISSNIVVTSNVSVSSNIVYTSNLVPAVTFDYIQNGFLSSSFSNQVSESNAVSAKAVSELYSYMRNDISGFLQNDYTLEGDKKAASSKSINNLFSFLRSSANGFLVDDYSNEGSSITSSTSKAVNMLYKKILESNDEIMDSLQDTTTNLNILGRLSADLPLETIETTSSNVNLKLNTDSNYFVINDGLLSIDHNTISNIAADTIDIRSSQDVDGFSNLIAVNRIPNDPGKYEIKFDGTSLLDDISKLVANEVFNIGFEYGENDYTMKSNFTIGLNSYTCNDSYIGSNANVGNELSVNSDTYCKSNVHVSSNIYIGNDLSIKRNLICDSVTLQSGNISDDLLIGKDAYINGFLSIRDNLYASSNIFINSALSVGNTVNVEDDITCKNDLSIGNNCHVFCAHITSNAFISEDLSVSGNVYMQQNTTMDTLHVTNKIHALDSVEIATYLSVNGTLTIDDDAKMNSDLDITGFLSVGNRMYISNNLYASGQLSIANKLYVKDTARFENVVYAKDKLSVGNILNANVIKSQDDISVGNEMFVENDVHLKSALIVTGSLSITQKLNIENDINANASVYIAEKLSIGNNLNVNKIGISSGGDVDSVFQIGNLNSSINTKNDMILVGRQDTNLTDFFELNFINNINTNAKASIKTKLDGSSNGVSLSMYTSDNSSDSNTYERLKIQGNGDVRVTSNLYVEKDIFIQNDGHFSKNMIIEQNLSIGNQLHVYSNIQTQGKFIGDGSLLTNVGADSLSYWKKTLDSNIYINNSNVGIGTSNPESAIHISALKASSPTYQGIHIGGTNSGNYGVDICVENNTKKSILDFSSISNLNSKGQINYDHQNHSFNFITSGSNETVKITENKVGINFNQPTAILHIDGNPDNQVISQYTTAFVAPYVGEFTNFVSSEDSSSSSELMIRAEGDIAGQKIFAFSDTRIKKDIQDIEDEEALDCFRKLKPVKYKYVDTLKNSTEDVYGFLAQQVRSVFKQGSKITEGIIPNIFETTVYDYTSNTIQFTNFNASNLDGTQLVFKTQAGNIFSAVKKIIDESVVVIDTDLSAYTYQSSNIFCYGQSVDDFHILDKNAIFTLASAAIQEIDRIQIEHEEKITTILNRMSNIEQKLTYN